MEKFIIHCTAEQTKRAIKLGAPICPTCYGDGFTRQIYYDDPENKFTGKSYYNIPTTQQMIGWLRSKQFIIVIDCDIDAYELDKKWHYLILDHCVSTDYDTYEEAELAAIEKALNYLEKGK